MNSLRNVVTQSEKDGVALGHFNVANLVMLKAVLGAAAETHFPVLVGASERERDFLGYPPTFRSVQKYARGTRFGGIPERGPYHSLAKAVEAAKTGFDAVVNRLPALPFERKCSSHEGKRLKRLRRSIQPFWRRIDRGYRNWF